MRFRYLIRKYCRIFAWKRRFSKLRYVNDTDLLLNPFVIDKQYPSIIDGSSIYRFSKNDIYRMIIEKVVYSEEQIPFILKVCNPYTNTPLSKTQLFNLYVSSYDARETPWVLREYALTYFDRDVFFERHSSFLSHKALVADVCSLSNEEFRSECKFVLNRYILRNSDEDTAIDNVKQLDSIKIGVLRRYFTTAIVESFDSRLNLHESTLQYVKECLNYKKMMRDFL